MYFTMEFMPPGRLQKGHVVCWSAWNLPSRAKLLMVWKSNWVIQVSIFLVFLHEKTKTRAGNHWLDRLPGIETDAEKCLIRRWYEAASVTNWFRCDKTWAFERAHPRAGISSSFPILICIFWWRGSFLNSRWLKGLLDAPRTTGRCGTANVQMPNIDCRRAAFDAFSILILTWIENEIKTQRHIPSFSRLYWLYFLFWWPCSMLSLKKE